MFDPAALLIKTIGLALPVEAANGPAGQQPGESADAAGNGGFANLLALKLEIAEPAVTVPGAAQLAMPPAVPLVISPPRSTAPTSKTAKSLPATGNILPSVLPATLAPLAPRKALASPISAENVPVPEVASEGAAPATPQTAPAALTRRAASRVATQAAPVLSEAPETSQEAAAPQIASQPALLAMAAKQRPAERRRSAPEMAKAAKPDESGNEDTAQPDPKDLAKAEAALLPVSLAPADPALPAPIAAAVAVRAAQPAPVEFTPSPALAPAAKAPIAEVPVLPSEAAPAPAMPAQVRLALRLSAEPGRQEGEEPQSAAPACGTEETAFEATLPASNRAMPAPAALPPVAPAHTHGHVAALSSATIEAPADFAQIVDRLVAARDAVAPAEVRVTLDHAQFGKVSVGFTPEASGMNVTLAAADPEFARAVEAAAPFAPPATSETPPVAAPTPSRGGDLPATLTGQQGQQSQQFGRQQQPADPRGGSAQANTSNRAPDSEARGTRGRGIFA